MSALLVSPHEFYNKGGLATIGVVNSLKIKTKLRHMDRSRDIGLEENIQGIRPKLL